MAKGMTPRGFLEAFVEPALAEWRADPLSVRRAIVAICEIDNLAEHTILHEFPTLTRAHPERDRIGALVPMVAIARDVHDTHKHGRLTRRNAAIKDGQRPRKEYEGGAFQAGAFQEDAFDVGTPVLIVVEDNGTEHLVKTVIDDALAFWHGELVRLRL
jgi:hypothetical protein